MKVLGIDPGTIIMGYGVIESLEANITLITFGTLKPSKRSPVAERLNFLFLELIKLVKKYRPEVIAVEQPFVARNPRSALAVGQAQAVAFLASANQGIPCFEYTPAEVKQRVANYGASSKEQIQQMVMLQLGLSHIPQPDDAADSLAVALCHLQSAHLQELLKQNP